MRALILLSTCALLSSGHIVDAVAEQLPARTYTTTDGLTGNVVMGLDVDSRRFLWVSTRDGLSRFDGVHFTTYGVTDGLPTATVNGILETRAGVYWVETNKGACRFNPRGQRSIETKGLEPLFACLDVGHSSITNRVNVFVDDRHGGLWAGTDGGLFQLESRDGRDSFQPVRLPFVPPDHTAGSGTHRAGGRRRQPVVRRRVGRDPSAAGSPGGPLPHPDLQHERSRDGAGDRFGEAALDRTFRRGDRARARSRVELCRTRGAH